MKKIFAICLSLLCFTPCSAHSATTPCNQLGNRSSCLSHGGCFYSLVDGCDACPDDMYNPSQSDCNDNAPTDTSCRNECLACTNATGGWMSGAQQVANSIFDTNNQNEGLEYCAWVCQNGYFDDVAHNECFGCPTSTSGFMSYRASADISHISTCNSCGSDKYIIKKTVTENGEQGYKYYCGTCGLNVTQTETGNGTNVYTCTCPTTTNHNQDLFSTSYTECVCPTGATWNGTQCVCNDPDETIVLDTITNLYVCSSCSDSHAVLDDGVCKCDIGYYGTTNGLQTSCSKCPAGTTTNAIGATNVSQCQMSSNTQFCDSNGNCMNLIPSGANINITQPTNTPTNTPNSPQNYLQ